jgi:hypothetical protein
LLITIGALLFSAPFTAGAAEPAPAEGPDFAAVARAHSRELASVTSDAQALALFSSRLAAALDLKDSGAILANKRPATPADLHDGAIKLTAEFASWRLASGLKEAADADPARLQDVLREGTAQRDWLLTPERAPDLRSAIQLASVIGGKLGSQVPGPDPSQEYRDYAAHLDKIYPNLTGSVDSWLVFAQREGEEGIARRLLEGTEGRSDSERQGFASRYFQTRLRSVLTAHLAASAIRAEAEAEQRARQEWRRLRNWREQLNERKGLARLCGTWHWTVHNHQHHQEYKLMISFAPPDAPNGPGPRPAKIVVLGDAVYLRWDFERGITQEDSLLFAGEGQRLEGTFVNSSGPWGSIAAKRTAACGRSDTPSPPTSQTEPAGSPRPGTPGQR